MSMKIAFVTNHPIDGDGDPHRVGYQKSARSMYRALVGSGFDVSVMRLGRVRRPLHSHVRERACRLLGRRYRPHLEPAVLDAYARQVAAWLDRHPTDLVFSPASTSIAHLERPEPIVVWRDSTFAGAREAHRNFQNLCRRSLMQGEAMERQALARTSLALFRSEWAAASAIDHYGADPAKVKVIPTGGNLDFAVDEAEIMARIEGRTSDPICRLIFVGTDWTAKGGELALAVAHALQARGHAVELSVIGCRPPAPLPPWVQVRGFADTRTPAGQALLRDALLAAHFLLVPSRFEPYGNVFPEANSLGVPCVARRVGGIATIVRNGVNGQTFAADATAGEYADYIAAQLQPAVYAPLARSAYAEYRNRLSWERAGATLSGLLRVLYEEHDRSRREGRVAHAVPRDQSKTAPLGNEAHA